MSNVIEFKKKPEVVPAQSVEIGPEHYTPEHYRLSDLIRYEYSDRSWADRDGYAYQHTLEQHAQLVAFFAAFGLQYDDYAHSAVRAWLALVEGFVPHVLMCLEHAGTWNLVRNGQDAERIGYIEAVARQDKSAIQRYRHVAQKVLDAARAKQEEAENTVQRLDVPLPAEASMLERGIKNLPWTGALHYRFPSFEKTGSGQYAIADEGQQSLFVRFAYVCGWSYADISCDKMRLEEVANICIGTLGLAFYWMTVASGSRWNKAAAEKAFPGCSDKFLQYLSACHGRRVDSARKLRDAVWPELQDWARCHPFDRSLFGRT
ncbi:Uncharacterised protein [Burkholderia pseudomallei]|uniref:hypothetical protein n=1 Tax=Burkholderia pseudomallei TaxID=28450 RepID=UPI000F07EC82|nr:hypothetical protein [Burkholderia pseudomallei]CAJ7236194.1 Uncharacterised protein [Burkholderia pseudomallei]VBC15532.1 Uncharacterised protein [Burkholderia pseudomallei]VBS98845.1 Uncharacterised protein [Burkholderia pseudomallei]